ERVELGAEYAAHVLFERRLNLGRLEEELVEHRVLVLGHQRRRRHRAAKRPRPERRTESNHAPETIRAQQCGLPGDRRADVVAGNDRLLDTECVEQADDVADEMQHGVFLDTLGAIAAAIAAQVERYRAESGLGECAKLMPPGIPALGKAVAENDERALALFRHVDADAV